MTATTPTTLECIGQRLYFRGSPFAAKDRIKGIGGKWDPDQRCWWIGAKKRAEAERLVAEINNGVTEASRDAAGSVGLRTDAPPYMVSDKLREEGHEEAADRVQASTQAQEDPHRIRLTGKCEYKGRTYYMGFKTRDGQRVRLLTLPDSAGKYLDFWASAAEVRVVKTYTPREVWDGRRYSGRTRTEYTTLGGIADFVRDQRRAEKDGVQACADCGKRSHDLVRDLEDGGMKCQSCCDIPE